MRRPTLIAAAIVFAVFLILDTAGLLELFGALAWDVARHGWPWLLAGCVLLAGFLALRHRPHAASPRRRGRTSRRAPRSARPRAVPAARAVSSRRRLR